MPNIDTSLPGINLSGSALIKSGNGTLRRIIVNSATSATITVYDSTTGSGLVLLQSFPLTAGATPQFDLSFQNGCYVALTGTANYTVVYY